MPVAVLELSEASPKENRAVPCSVKPRLCRPCDFELICWGLLSWMKGAPVFPSLTELLGNITGTLLHKYKGQTFVQSSKGNISSSQEDTWLLSLPIFSTILAVNCEFLNTCHQYTLIKQDEQGWGYIWNKEVFREQMLNKLLWKWFLSFIRYQRKTESWGKSWRPPEFHAWNF